IPILILRGIRMAGEPTDRRFWTVVFLASVDFCCILLATERYDKGSIEIGTAWLIAGVVFSLIGWKWPQIRGKKISDSQAETKNETRKPPTAEETTPEPEPT